MIKKTLIILALLSLGAGVPAALAQHGHSSHHSLPHHENHAIHNEHVTHGVHNGIHLPSDEMLKEWGCDKAMIKTLRGLQLKLEEDSTDLQVALKKAEEALEEAHKDENVSERTLHSAIDELYEAKADLLKRQATAAVEAREIMGEELFGKIHEAHMD
jgi:hypothetical protein